jgi:hypothetical protein
MLKLFTVLGVAAIVSAYPEQDKVDSLWQMPDLGNGVYSGYVKIDNT